MENQEKCTRTLSRSVVHGESSSSLCRATAGPGATASWKKGSAVRRDWPRRRACARSLRPADPVDCRPVGSTSESNLANKASSVMGRAGVPRLSRTSTASLLPAGDLDLDPAAEMFGKGFLHRLVELRLDAVGDPRVSARRSGASPMKPSTELGP